MDFATARLLDLKQDWAALEASANPFAVVVMAHAKHYATRRNFQARLAWKLDLTKALYRRGYDRTQVIALYRFLDWVMTLPEEYSQAMTSPLSVGQRPSAYVRAESPKNRLRTRCYSSP